MAMVESLATPSAALRIGVFGGTFDPIHLGHLVAAEETRARLRLDQVLFVPARVPPQKVGNDISPAHHRVAMIRLAIASNPSFALSEVDIERPGTSYTVDTLRLLRDKWPLAELYFIMGMDSLVDLLDWKDPHRIVQLARLAVVGRPGFDTPMSELERELPGIRERVEFVDAPHLEISSSDLRWRVRAGLPIRYQVPEPVETYIRENNLYIESQP